MREMRMRAWTVGATLRTAFALTAAIAATAAPSARAATLEGFAWGANGGGQLGDGTTEASNAPVALEGLGGVAALAGGEGHTIALMDDGTVMAWGQNAYGELGDGTTEASDTPVAVSGLEGVTAVAAAGHFALALLEDGTVMAWGGNDHGQLGNGTTEASDVPVVVRGLSGVEAIAAGGNHALALLADGTAMAWGENKIGQLGDGTTSERDVPVAVKSLSDVTAIAAGARHSLAVVGGETVWAWGANGDGELGNGHTVYRDHPVEVHNIDGGVTAVAAGSEDSFALLGDGTFRAWGLGRRGQLGVGTTRTVNNLPQASEFSGFVAIAARGESTVGLLSDGNVATWGSNAQGELGLGEEGDVAEWVVPVEVPGLCQMAGVGAGYEFTLAVGQAGAPCPTITGISPDEAGAGESVTITGTELAEATAVHFGRTPANFVVGSSTSITAEVPQDGGWEVSVTTPRGTSVQPRSGATRFHYPPAPQVSRVSPTKGPLAGGTVLTITGSQLATATQVWFGSVPARQFEARSNEEIVAVSPAEPAGSVNVTVTGPGGTSTADKRTRFRYKK